MSAPTITSDDLNPVTAGATACDHLAELANTRSKLQDIVEWLYNDAGEIQGFKEWLLEQLFKTDTTKKGWYLQTNASTGALELVEKISLEGLDDGSASDGDFMRWDADAIDATHGAWVVWHQFASTQSAIPAASTGGKVQTAHGLGARPTNYRAELICTDADGSYAVGDAVDAMSLIEQGGGGEVRPGLSVGVDATNIWAVFSKDGTVGRKYYLADKGTFLFDGGTEIDTTKWQIKFYAS